MYVLVSFSTDFCKPKFKSAVKPEKHVLIVMVKDHLHWANWDTFGNMRWQQFPSTCSRSWEWTLQRPLSRGSWPESGPVLVCCHSWVATKWVMMSGKKLKGWTAPRQLPPQPFSLGSDVTAGQEWQCSVMSIQVLKRQSFNSRPS